MRETSPVRQKNGRSGVPVTRTSAPSSRSQESRRSCSACGACCFSRMTIGPFLLLAYSAAGIRLSGRIFFRYRRRNRMTVIDSEATSAIGKANQTASMFPESDSR